MWLSEKLQQVTAGYLRRDMARIEKDETREERIDMEIVVDAYDAEERAMGWYSYLDDILNFFFCFLHTQLSYARSNINNSFFQKFFLCKRKIIHIYSYTVYLFCVIVKQFL